VVGSHTLPSWITASGAVAVPPCHFFNSLWHSVVGSHIYCITNFLLTLSSSIQACAHLGSSSVWLQLWLRRNDADTTTFSGDTIPHVIRFLFPTLYKIPVLSLFASRQFVVAFCTLTVSYPLSLYRDIHKLSRASGLALIGMVIIVTSVIIEGAKVTPELRGSSSPSVRFSVVTPRITEAIGVISFAFVCHHNSLLIYGGLRTPTLDRFAYVTHISTLMSLVACLTLAVSAFLIFTDKTHGNILNNFSQVCLRSCRLVSSLLLNLFLE
jgi:Transmembrane amino acid transporter protein